MLNLKSIDSVMDFDDRDELIEQFALITKIDKELAQEYLLKHDFNLNIAISNYFNTENNIVIDLTEDYLIGDQDSLSKDPQHSRFFRVMSWNIEGLNEKSLDSRNDFIIEEILNDIPHVVCLQEVIPTSHRKFENSKLSQHYHFISPPISIRHELGYYVVILVRKACGITLMDQRFGEFANSQMGRHFIVSTLLIKLKNSKKVMVRICTSHLESCAEFSSARKEQLKQCWNEMINFSSSPEAYSIFCGDLNLRDKEIKELNGLPKELSDVWDECGARKEAKNTWDPQRNTNISFRQAFGCRFDRLFYTKKNANFRAVDFELRGLRKVPGSTMFPSDHWAILGHFEIL